LAEQLLFDFCVFCNRLQLPVRILASLETRNLSCQFVAHFSSAQDIVYCVLSGRASVGESFDEVTLDLAVARVLHLTVLRFPVQVSRDVSFIVHWVPKVSQGAFLVAAE
jgi:hypothetical protein